MRLILANQSTAAKRRVYFHLVDVTDGITAETGESGGQPQVSSDGAAWTNTGIGTLSSIGNGRYYAELTQTLVLTAGTIIETRFKSAATAECPGDSVQVVAFDPDDTVRLGLTALPNVASGSSGAIPTTGTGSNQISVSSGQVILQTGTGTGQLDFTAGVVKSNSVQWVGGTIPAVSVTGVPLVDITYMFGTILSTPTVPGVPNVNVKTWNDLTTVALPLIPTIAGRTLDVTAAGNAGIDWNNIENPTATVNMTGTTISTVSTATAVTTVNGLAANVITSTAIATSAVDLVVDAVWDEMISGHLTAGSTGAALNSSAGDPWSTALPGAYVAGSAGFIVGTYVNALITSRATPAEVNAEVLDVLNVDTFAEVGQESPAATTTIRKMIGLLYKAWRNKKTQTASQFSLFADDATTVDQKATVSDDGTTTTIGEITTGP